MFNFLPGRPDAGHSLLHNGEIEMDGKIGPASTINVASIRSAVGLLPPEAPIVLRLSGLNGGNISEAMKIYLLLRECGRHVTAHIEEAHSAGTFVAMAATEISMCENEFFDPRSEPRLRRDPSVNR